MYEKNRVQTHLSHALHDAELLSGNETLEHCPDGHVDVVFVHVVPQVQTSMCLCQSDCRLDLTDCCGDAACFLLSEDNITSHHDLVMPRHLPFDQNYKKSTLLIS